MAEGGELPLAVLGIHPVHRLRAAVLQTVYQIAKNTFQSRAREEQFLNFASAAMRLHGVRRHASHRVTRTEFLALPTLKSRRFPARRLYCRT